MEFSRIKPKTEQLSARVELSAEQGEGEQKLRRFTMLGYTGAEVARFYGRAVFSLSGIEHKDKVPILLNHDENAIVGYADEVKLTERGLELSGSISNATEEGRRVAQLSDEGFPWEASVGLQVSEWREIKQDESLAVNGRDVHGPISVGLTSRLLEVSFLPAGADKFTAATVLAAQQQESSMSEPVTKTDPRQELKAYLAAFPGREAWAAKLCVEGVPLSEAHAKLNAELIQELAAEKKKREETEAKLAELEALKSQARHPGVGFDGPAREQPEAKPKLGPEQAWETDAKLRAEFGNSKSAFLAYVKREGWEVAA